MLGETVVCAAVFPHLQILLHIQVQYYPSFWQLYSNPGEVSHGICQVMQIFTDESNLDRGLLTQQTCCFHPSLLVS